MRITLSRGIAAAVVAAAVGMATGTAHAAVNVAITPSSTLLNFINVFELPANGGGYIFGQPYDITRLQANFQGQVLQIGPMRIDDSSSFWFQGPGTNPGGPGAPGNKNIDASAYVQDDTLAGQTLTMTGRVLSNNLVAPYTSVAFIKDFAADYSSNTGITVPLNVGPFSITFATTPGHHIQYGYETIGPDVWITDGATKGFVNVVPEPTTLAAVAGGSLSLLRRRRTA